MKKRILLIVLAALSAGVLFMIGMTSAYFTDVEVKENVITIGKVSIELDESPFDPSTPHDVVPGSKTEKTPNLIEKVKTDFTEDGTENIDNINDFDIVVYTESVQTTEIDQNGTQYTDANWQTAWQSFLSLSQ